MLGTTVQTKLTVGAPHDPYEQEADRVADTVTRMTEPQVSEGRLIPGRRRALVLSETRRSCVGSLWKKIVSRVR